MIPPAIWKNKILPSEFKTQCIKALECYPELCDTAIHFKLKPGRFPLKSYPEPYTLFFKRDKRRYVIEISTDSGIKFRPLLLKNIPSDGQVGVIGHELAHTLDYQNKSTIELIIIGIKYLLSSSFRKKFERNTDLITIRHGLGKQLLTWRMYYENLDLSFSNNLFFEDRYLNSLEIRNFTD